MTTTKTSLLISNLRKGLPIALLIAAAGTTAACSTGDAPTETVTVTEAPADEADDTEEAPAEDDAEETTAEDETTDETTDESDDETTSDDDADSTDDDSDDSGSSSLDSGDLAESLNPAMWSSLVTTELTCEDGVLDVDQAGEVVAVTDDCGDLTVSGTGTVVIAQDVDSLTVTGDGVVVLAQEVDAVDLTSTGSAVGWTSGDPTFSDNGDGNVVTKIAG